MKIEFEGQLHEFPDDATEAEIASILGGGGAAGGTAEAPASDTSMLGRLARGYVRYQGLNARVVYGGAAKGVTGLATLAADAGINAAYGGKKLLSRYGLAEEPNPENYYKGRGYLPTTEAVGDKIDAGLYKVGLPRAEGAEKGPAAVAEAVAEAVAGSLVPAGIARGLTGGVARFLAAKPFVGATASGVAAGATETAKGLDPEGNLPGWVAPAIGVTSGLATGLGISGGRAFMGYDPVKGKYIRSTNEAGQTEIANEIVQGMASNPARAAENLRGQTARETAPGFVAPGYEELTTNAARDAGLAGNASKLRTLAGDAIPERMAENNRAIDRRFNAEGAEPGAADVARGQARAGNADLDEFGLTAASAARNSDPVDVTPFLSRLQSDTDLRSAGNTASNAAASSEVADLIRRSANEIVEIDPATGARRVVGYEMAPERLQSIRNSVSESLRPTNANSGPNTLPSVANARRHVNENIQRRIDDLLAGNTPAIPLRGAGDTEIDYRGYMARQSGLRTEADRRGFMEALADSVSDPSRNAVTGSRQYNPSALARLSQTRNQQRPIRGASRSMTVEGLDPARRTFIDQLANLGEEASYANSRGMATRGSNTNALNATDESIRQAVIAGRAPYERVIAAIPVINGLGFMVGGKSANANNQVARGLGRVLDQRIPDAAVAIKGRLGQVETNREAAISMLTGGGRSPRGFKISAKRGAANFARTGVRSFLAANR